MSSLAILLVLTAMSQVDAPKREGKTAAEWLQQLPGSDAAARVRTCQVLGDFGRHGLEAVEALKKQLEDDHADVRFAAADALRRIGPPAKDAVLALLKVVKEDDDKSVRIAAIKALGGIGPLAKGAVSSLTAASGDRDSKVAIAVIESLGGIGAPNKETKDTLVRAMRDADPDLRIAALRTWADVVADPETDRELLVPALSDSNKDVRFAALEAWRRGGKSAAGSLRPAFCLLEDSDPELRRAAVTAFAPGPPVAADTAVAEAIKPLLLDQDGGVRVAVVLGLSKRVAVTESGPVYAVDEPAFAALLAQFKNDNPTVRAAAATVLRTFAKRDDPQSVEALNQLLDDANPAVHRAAAVTLLANENGDPKALGKLLAQLRHIDANVRAEAAQALVLLGVRAKSAMPELLVTREVDPSPVVRQYATLALGMVASGLEERDYKHVLAELTVQMEDKVPLVRIAAAVGFIQARAATPEAITLLRQSLRDADPEIRLATVRMVSSSPHFPKELAAAVEELLNESVPEIRRLAASILARKE